MLNHMGNKVKYFIQYYITAFYIHFRDRYIILKNFILVANQFSSNKKQNSSTVERYGSLDQSLMVEPLTMIELLPI